MYEVGDKVRIISTNFDHYCNHICTIIEVCEFGDYPYKVQDDKDSWTCLMLNCELEPVIPVGQQLEFDFMKE